MTTQTPHPDLTRYGDPAPITRMFGWIMLTTLAAFMINNVLTVGFEFPGTAAAFSVGGGAWLQVGIHAVAIAVAIAYVIATPDRALRWDALNITNFNIYLIRACFWAVLMIGIVDASIAFMRIEGLLEPFFSDPDFVKQFGRVQFVGPNIHIPLIILALIIAYFSRTLGFTWLTLLIVGAELLIVISRFVFSYEQALMGDLVRYWYAALFLFASAYTLLDEGHVRVDVLYAGFSTRTKGISNTIGSILLGMTTAWVIIYLGFNGKTAIINSPVANMEVTQTGGTGMFVKYQMAAFLGVFAITMLIQFVSYLFEAVADMRGQPGKREIAPVSH
ncbi:MAG: TRAP transporter small permease subunit [Pikeienuella sp.]